MSDDEYNHHTGVCNGNWWEPSRNRFDVTGGSPPPPSAPRQQPQQQQFDSFRWPPSVRSFDSDSSSAASRTRSSAAVYEHAVTTGDGVIVDPNLQMMNLALSSHHQPMDWNNQNLLHRSKAEEEGYQEINRNAASGGGGGGSLVNFSLLDQQQQQQQQFDSRTGSVDSSYGNIPTTILQGILGPHNDHQNRSISYAYSGNFSGEVSASSSGVSNSSNSWTSPPPSDKFFPPHHQFMGGNLSSPPPKPLSQPPQDHMLHFCNNGPYWQASAAGGGGAGVARAARTGFPPSPQNQIPLAAGFDEKPPKMGKGRESSTVVVKRGGSDDQSGMKRGRSETPSPSPAFKVRKEKMGDRITALQQLVSPFGKTDTTSVLSEAIEYIKFLHQQVSALSTGYMTSTGAPIQHQQVSADRSRDSEGPKPDLRSRGLCLVPVTSTFPVTQENMVDFWMPTFGGGFR